MPGATATGEVSAIVLVPVDCHAVFWDAVCPILLPLLSYSAAHESPTLVPAATMWAMMFVMVVAALIFTVATTALD